MSDKPDDSQQERNKTSYLFIAVMEMKYKTIEGEKITIPPLPQSKVNRDSFAV